MTPVKGYTEMKGSGIPWIGEIPCHWDIRRNKTVFSCEKEIVGENSANIQLLSLTTNGIRKKSVDDTSGKVPESYDTYQYVHKDNLVLCLFDLDCSAVFSGLSKYEGMISPAYKVIKCNDNIVPGYADYWFRSVFDGRKFKYLAKNIRYSLTYEDFSALTLPHPPLSEQSAIAAYLDTQCAKIDEIIAQAKASIEDYKQWKASIIYEAVTKGLDPNVEMKDSGIEWIGKMPAHWTAPALKHLCTMQAGKNLISEQISTSGRYPVYGGNGQRGYYSDYNVNGNFLLVGRQGALCGNVHCVSGKFWATEHAVVTTPSKITNIRYLYYLLIAMDLNQYASNSAAQPGLSVGNILTVKTLLPPIDEQVRISEFLDNCCPRIDEVITEKQSLIDDLESYKKSLIYEVVTGKRRVC